MVHILPNMEIYCKEGGKFHTQYHTIVVVVVVVVVVVTTVTMRMRARINIIRVIAVFNSKF